MHIHKAYFQEPTKGEISQYTRREAQNNLVDRISSLGEQEHILINRILIPENYNNSWHFLRHGDRVHLRFRDLIQRSISKRNAAVPVDLRIREFDALKEKAGAFSGYDYTPLDIKPYNHQDTRTRRVSLVECLEGARIYAYTHQVPMPPIEVEQYTDAKAVEKDGAFFHVHVPSRIKGQGRYRFNLTSVPIRDNLNKWSIAWATASEGHDCLRGMYMGIRYAQKEDSQIFNWCAHEIAAYIATMNKMNHRGTRTPLQMSQIALPTQLTVNFYKRLCDSVLINDAKVGEKENIRVLNKAEQEYLLWGLVHKKGHNPTFFAEANLKNYDWKLRHLV
ncbi:MAG: hypothetical protein Q8R18_04365 [bacterium]|nr:hypothetical protein [bacterium]